MREQIASTLSPDLAPDVGDGDSLEDRLGGETSRRDDAVPHGLAEIAMASSALRRVEPTLSNWHMPRSDTAHSARDVYVLIALIWTSITLVIGGSIATVLWLSA